MKIRKARKEDLKECANIFRVESKRPPYRMKRTSKKSLERVKGYFKEKKCI